VDGFVVTLLHEGTWRISVYGREHGVPHFHIEGRGFRCSVSIETQVLIIGVAPSAVLKSACVWASQHRAELLAKWRELNR
jgi:Domain of unknown function (DUF4160)